MEKIMIKDYFWPTAFVGVKDISVKGKEQLKDKITAWNSNNEYEGARSVIGDDEIRLNNRNSALPHMNKYIKRWVVLTLILLSLEYVFAYFEVFLLEVTFTLVAIISFLSAVFLAWLKRDMIKPIT
jgi:hypothetical protein